jgi:hypothetical protein
MDPGTGQEDVKKRKILHLLGLELRALGRPTSCYTACTIPAPYHDEDHDDEDDDHDNN